MDLAEAILNEAVERMIDDGRPLAEVALALVEVGLGHLADCCESCRANAADLLREHLAALEQDAPRGPLH